MILYINMMLMKVGPPKKKKKERKKETKKETKNIFSYLFELLEQRLPCVRPLSKIFTERKFNVLDMISSFSVGAPFNFIVPVQLVVTAFHIPE